MPHFGKRNLVMLLVIKIFVIGLFLSGCQEGTNKSPVSSLLGIDMNQATVDLTSLGDDVAKHNIVGTVVSQNTGEKLANITVSLIYENQLAATTKTTSDGQFYFAKVPAGLFDLAFASPDNTYASTTYILRVLEDGTTAPANPEVKMVAVNPEQINVQAKIEGEVMSSNGQKIANINIELRLNNDIISTALTGTLGQFSFSNLGIGSYTLRVGEASNYNAKNVVVEIRDNGVVLPRYSIVSLTPIDVEKKYAIAGIVKNQNDTIIGNVKVELYKSDDPPDAKAASSIYTYTTGEGKFVFTDLSDTTIYFLRACSNTQAQTATSSFYPVRILDDGLTSPASAEIIVNRATIEPHTASGTIYDAFTNGALEYVSVKLDNKGTTLTDKHGKFSISNLIAGIYSLEISKFGYETLRTSFIVKEKEDGSGFESTPDNLVYPLLHALKSGYGSIAGRFLNTIDGSGIPNLYVYLYNWVEKTKNYDVNILIDGKSTTRTRSVTGWEIDGGVLLTTKTLDASSIGTPDIPDIDGAFKLTHLTPGYYTICFTASSTPPATKLVDDETAGSSVQWEIIDDDKNGYIGEINRLKVEDGKTTYWTNYEPSESVSW